MVLCKLYDYKDIENRTGIGGICHNLYYGNYLDR